jgi:flagellar motor component MotA
MKKIIKLKESDLTNIVKRVIREGAYNNLRRSPVLNITDDQVLAWYFYDVATHLENDYDVEHFDGTKIPDYIKPYMDEIVDGINFEELNEALWETIFNHIWDAPELEDMLEKLGDELKSQGKAWD